MNHYLKIQIWVYLINLKLVAKITCISSLKGFAKPEFVNKIKARGF